MLSFGYCLINLFFNTFAQTYTYRVGIILQAE